MPYDRAVELKWRGNPITSILGPRPRSRGGSGTSTTSFAGSPASTTSRASDKGGLT